MFDLGWQELFVIGTVTLIVVGPKDLPKLLNRVGKVLGKIKQVAREFYDQINETAEIEEINNLKKDGEIEKANNLGSELKMLSQSLGILQKNPADYFKSGVDLTDKEIENLIDQRTTARQNRDFALSDSIRNSLLEKGIILEDKETGTIWKKN